ncbi:MAG: M15 family metallopeptidase [Microthrixaceae bacterium]
MRVRVVLLAVVSALALLAGNLSVADAATYPCSYGTPGRAPLVDDLPEGRPYEPGTDALSPSDRKVRAMTTANADGSRGFCECTRPRPWAEGLDLGAAASLRIAMDAKEREALANYGRFGVPPDAVPVDARTIWLRTAWRSRDEQECLYSRFGPDWAARPGTSRHEFGFAVDLEDWGPASFGQDARLLRANGWCRTVPDEPWHFEFRPVLEFFGLGNRCVK